MLRVLDIVPGLRHVLRELGRVELLDRSMALAAQALLALIPMLMALGAFAPKSWGRGVLDQIRDIIGTQGDTLEPLREVTAQQLSRTDTGLLGLVLAVVSATSFSRAMQRMYARVWELPGAHGIQSLRGSILWLVGWVLMLQATAMLLRSVTGVPLTGVVKVAIQVAANTLLWWWSARLLLAGRKSWRRLLPGALLSGLALVAYSHMSSLFMPAFVRANLDQYGPLGVVFSVGSWLVGFCGLIVVAAVVGRAFSDWWWPGRDESAAHRTLPWRSSVRGSSPVAR